MKEQNYLDHLVGVFGQPVAENPGVIIQDAAFAAMGLERWHFLTLDVDKDQLENAINGLKAFKMRGINCTIPHKIAVMQYLDEISESAQLIGAVNTIVNTDGRLYGDNTDGKGFMMSLESNGIDVKGKRIVVLGAGGAEGDLRSRQAAGHQGLAQGQGLIHAVESNDRNNADLVNTLQNRIHSNSPSLILCGPPSSHTAAGSRTWLLLLYPLGRWASIGQKCERKRTIFVVSAKDSAIRKRA